MHSVFTEFEDKYCPLGSLSLYFVRNSKVRLCAGQQAGLVCSWLERTQNLSGNPDLAFNQKLREIGNVVRGSPRCEGTLCLWQKSFFFRIGLDPGCHCVLCDILFATNVGICVRARVQSCPFQALSEGKVYPQFSHCNRTAVSLCAELITLNVLHKQPMKHSMHPSQECVQT